MLGWCWTAGAQTISPEVRQGDPSKKIEDIEKVETVFEDGIGYDSAKLIE
jgi:hypothetical protein